MIRIRIKATGQVIDMLAREAQCLLDAGSAEIVPAKKPVLTAAFDRAVETAMKVRACLR